MQPRQRTLRRSDRSIRDRACLRHQRLWISPRSRPASSRLEACRSIWPGRPNGVVVAERPAAKASTSRHCRPPHDTAQHQCDPVRMSQVDRQHGQQRAQFTERAGAVVDWADCGTARAFCAIAVKDTASASRPTKLENHPSRLRASRTVDDAPIWRHRPCLAICRKLVGLGAATSPVTSTPRQGLEHSQSLSVQRARPRRTDSRLAALAVAKHAALGVLDLQVKRPLRPPHAILGASGYMVDDVSPATLW